MAEQKSITQNYATPYKFTGKELDEETGLYYFGARYYAPRESIWLSVDPLAEKYPNESPYIYCGNNPIVYIDPDGRFKIPIHARITENASRGNSFSKSFMNDLQIGIQGADYGGFALDFHFDGRQNYSQVQNTWSQLNSDIESTVSNIGSMNKCLGGYDVSKLGVLLHNLQDFYSHSNYVDLYVEYYKSKNDGEMPSTVPFYDSKNGGTKDKEFKNILKGQLRTGDFDLKDNEAVDIDPFHENANSPTSHNQMNKDRANTPNGKLAEKVATEHTAKILKKVE